MTDFKTRAVEVHSSYAWDYRHIVKVLVFAEKTGLNGLVLHRNDIVEQVVFPGVQFGVEEGACGNIYERYREAYRKIYKYTPTRRSPPLLRRGYLRRVVEEARRRGIEVYLQNKELSFPDIFLELYPSLIKDGHGCPNEPFWWEFLRIKYTELFEDIPGIAGIITSVGTGESRISITSNRCTCEVCRKTSPEEWYRKVIDVIHRAVTGAGKRLVLRDFVFTRKAHDELASAFAGLPGDIAVAIKDTPHDYYPTFPQNGLIEKIRDREKWIEYDTMGQYFGWGIGPATMISYMRERMASALAKGASCLILRTDWESLDGHTCFDTPNLLNLYAGAVFGRDPSASPGSVYRAWLDDKDAFSPDTGEDRRGAVAKWIAAIFDRNWDVVRRALYMRDCVFNDCSTFPVGLGQALWLAEEKNSLKDWVPEAKDALLPSSSNTEVLLQEKDKALELVEDLVSLVSKPPEGLSRRFAGDLRERYRVFELYIRGFRVVGRLFALIRWAEAGGQGPSFIGGRDLSALISEAFQETDEVIELYEEFYRETAHPSAVYQLINPERLRCFQDDCRRSYYASPSVP
jgi:hypothetical protein